MYEKKIVINLFFFLIYIGKSGKKNKKCKKEINKKGSEKEGSDMDMFTNIEKPSPNIEKIRGSEKISQPSVTTHSSNLNTSASNRKTNSSQKSIDVKVVIYFKIIFLSVLM